MNESEAAKGIREHYPTLSEYEIIRAIGQQAEAEIGRAKRNRQRLGYGEAVTSAYNRIHEWLDTGASDYSVDPADIDSVITFITSHQPACVWAVLRSKQLHQKGK